MTRRLFQPTIDLDCPVCSRRHKPGSDCNDWPYMYLHPTYPFAPPTPTPRESKPNVRGKRAKHGPEHDRAHRAAEQDRAK